MTTRRTTRRTATRTTRRTVSRRGADNPFVGIGDETAMWIPSKDSAGRFTATGTDMAGNGHSVALTNMDPATDWVNDGGYCWDFDGTNDRGQIADHDDFSSFDGVSSDTPLTISLHVKTRTHGAGKGCVISKQDHTAVNMSEWSVFFDDTGHFGWYLYDWTTNHYITSVSDDAAATNTWYHVVGTYAGSESETGLNLYVNGTLLNQTRSTAGTYVRTHNTTSNVQLGASRYLDSAARFLDGRLDDIRFFRRVISAAEIAHLGTRGVAGPAP